MEIFAPKKDKFEITAAVGGGGGGVRLRIPLFLSWGREQDNAAGQ